MLETPVISPSGDHRIQNQKTRIQVPVLIFTVCWKLGRLLEFSGFLLLTLTLEAMKIKM